MLSAFLLVPGFVLASTGKVQFIDNFAVSIEGGYTHSRLGEPYTYFGFPANHASGMSSIELFENPLYPCTPEALGTYEGAHEPYASPLHHIEGVGEVTIWAKHPITGLESEPLKYICYFPAMRCNEANWEDGYSKCDIKASAYSFCSVRDGTTVAICIYQQLDNPKMAQEVFESFRWLEPTDIFHDVPESHSQSQAIAYVKDQEIVSGYPDGTFRPSNSINRAEFTKIVVGAVQDEVASGSGCFLDVNDEWFAPFVCTASSLGLVSGYPDGTFGPGNNINFAEAAKIVVNAFALPTEVPEEPGVSWYEPYVRALADANAIPLTINTLDHEITRGEMAEIIYRLDSSRTDLPSRTYEAMTETES